MCVPLCNYTFLLSSCVVSTETGDVRQATSSVYEHVHWRNLGSLWICCMLVLSTHIAVKFQPPHAMEICINFGSKVHWYSVIYLLFVLEGAGYQKNDG